MPTPTMYPEFKYTEIPIKDMEIRTVVTDPDDPTKTEVTAIAIGPADAPEDSKLIVKPTSRFWDSFMSKFGIGNSVFKYYTHKEVFERINLVLSAAEKEVVRAAIQMGPLNYESEAGFVPWQFAISTPDKPMLPIGEAALAMQLLQPSKVTYNGGIVVSQHALRRPMTWDIGAHKHTTMIILETPIDGYGKPTIWLMLMRDDNIPQVAYAKPFQTAIILSGKNTARDTLERAIDAFSNEDGFVTLKQRLESAQTSWASVYEALRLQKTMYKLTPADFTEEYLNTKYGGVPSDAFVPRNTLITDLAQKTGNISLMYMVAQIDSISIKRMKALPVKCKVSDLMDFATEVSTYLRPGASRTLQSYFGELISAEYDLEGTIGKYPKFDDYMLTTGDTAPQVEAVQAVPVVGQEYGQE